LLVEKMRNFKEERELEKLRQDNIKAGLTPEILKELAMIDARDEELAYNE